MRTLQGPPRGDPAWGYPARAERREGATPSSADMGKPELVWGVSPAQPQIPHSPRSRLLPFQLQCLQPVGGRGLRSEILAEFQYESPKTSPSTQTDPLSPPFASMRILAPHSP